MRSMTMCVMTALCGSVCVAQPLNLQGVAYERSELAEAAWFHDVEDLEDLMAAGREPRAAGEPRGIGVQRVWPEGRVLFDFTDEVIALWSDPPENPSEEELQKLLIIPNVVSVMLFVESVTADQAMPIRFVGYDPFEHSGLGFVEFGEIGPIGPDPASGYLPSEGRTIVMHDVWAFGEIMQSLALLIGMEREHRRADRDEHIQILHENIAGAGEPGFVGEEAFDILDRAGVLVVGEYDWESVLHPVPCYGSGNGEPTWEPVGGWNVADPCSSGIAQQGLSEGDIAMIQALYEGASVCDGDFNADQVLDFFDITAFLGAFAIGSPRADLAEPFGTLDFFDVMSFLAAFSAGCP